MFKKYAKIYDLFNLKKNYQIEGDYLLKLVSKYGVNISKNFLDIGCGTGKHANYLINKVDYVIGVDNSEEMLKVAKNNFPKINFQNLDYKHKIKFDVCYSFFHVFSYLKTDKEVHAFFKYASKNLKKNGLLIFDYWFKQSVIKYPPYEKNKYLKYKNQTILRNTEFLQVPKKDLIKIFFKFFIIKKRKIMSFKEVHEMRYFTKKKINSYLQKYHFKLINNFEWLKNHKPKNKWYACMILKKIT
jgi:SAM-dependent methyltransferase